MSRQCRSVLVCGALVAAAMAVCAAPALVAQAGGRDVYVSVFDKSGTPVLGLTQDYFAVREDGRDRAVVRAEPFAGPAHVAVLVDTSSFVEGAVEPYRSIVAAFITRLAPANEVAIYEFGERANRLVPFTRDGALLRDGMSRISARANAVPRLLDAIDLACRDLRAAEARRPVIVAVSIGGADTSTTTGGAVVKLLIQNLVSLHVVAVSNRSGPATPSLTTASGRSEFDRHDRLSQVSSSGEGQRESAQVLKDGTAKTAGSLQVVASVLAFGPALDRVHTDVQAAYRVTYSREGTGTSRDLQVGLMLEDVVVRAIAAPAATK
jgi:VWFA-related protein